MPTYYATAVYTGDAVEDEFDFPDVPFISTNDIEVLVAGAIKTLTTDYTIQDGGSGAVTAKQIKFETASIPTSGQSVMVRRKTSRTSLAVDFADGSTLTQADLDKATQQGIFLGIEAIDRATDAYEHVNNTVLGESDDLPDPAGGAEGNILRINSGLNWEIAATTALTSTLGLGTASAEDIGTGIGDIPVNVSPGGQVLGTAAYKAHGTGTGDVPLNSDLGTAAVLNVGTSNNNIIQADATGLPVIDGSQLTNVMSGVPTSYVSHRIKVGDSTYPDATLSMTANTWHVRPLTDVAHSGVSTNITLPGSNQISVPAGTWYVHWWCVFFRIDEGCSRLVDSADTGGTEIMGSTVVTMTNNYTSTSIGSGRFTLGETKLMELQVYVTETNSQADNLGKGVDLSSDETAGTSSGDQVFAQIEFQKEG